MTWEPIMSPQKKVFQPYLGFYSLSFLLQPLDPLVHFQDLVLVVAEVVTVAPGCQPQLLILPGPEVRAHVPTP